MGIDEDKRATLRRFAAVGAASPLAVVGNRDDDSEVREAILGYLGTTPGAHFSKVRDDLKLGTGEAQHHLRRLQDDGVIVSHRDGDYRRFFQAEQFSSYEQVAMSYLRRETPRGMIVALLRDPSATGVELADRLDVSRPTISTAASELEGVGLLDTTEGYRVARPETLLTLLVRYAESFDDRTAAFASDAASLVRYDP
ncbi:winged helix-turn-helix transcriptional regulator [Halanaeroarchaeum sulfurireducens]|uniref:MarR family transcriptional regulator n=1 Tax=Halanaeroarchaeum sulfurireducens TaxID=1604004 RepID=A0A0F7P7E8_9EURY|nr:MarR family transcriptional regulator [Halanaeroarchaeum sulfurireducens]AKH97131.1 MarR family transcriptional regulator [Halanaeroarchaeum sulfurireducens]ALG81532.1 MarR family transcriptional regulator [Halanaeroarchaeum sulfurireducens]